MPSREISRLKHFYAENYTQRKNKKKKIHTLEEKRKKNYRKLSKQTNLRCKKYLFLSQNIFYCLFFIRRNIHTHVRTKNIRTKEKFLREKKSQRELKGKKLFCLKIEF